MNVLCVTQSIVVYWHADELQHCSKKNLQGRGRPFENLPAMTRLQPGISGRPPKTNCPEWKVPEKNKMGEIYYHLSPLTQTQGDTRLSKAEPEMQQSGQTAPREIPLGDVRVFGFFFFSSFFFLRSRRKTTHAGNHKTLQVNCSQRSISLGYNG